MNTAKLIIECLRSAVCGHALDKKMFEGLSENDLKELYVQSKRHDVVHLVGAALDGEGMLKGREIAKHFSKQQLMAAYRCENIVYETKRIIIALKDANIDHIPLKGAVIRDLYPEMWMRTSCDIDILVRENDLDAAAEVLTEKLDYRVDGDRHYHDINLYSPGGVHLELHFSIKENIEQLDRVLERVWEHSMPVDGTSYKQNSEFLIYHIVAHMAYHFVSGGCGIRPFLDLWLIRSKLEFDESKVLELCAEGEIDKFYLSAVSLADAWFSGIEYNELTERMEQYILLGGVYGTQESLIAARQQNRGGKLGYARSRIFVSYDHLKTKYPSLKSKAFIPVYQVRRWVDVFRNKNVGRSVRELKTNASLDKERVSEVSSLMKELKLNDHIK